MHRIHPSHTRVAGLTAPEPGGPSPSAPRTTRASNQDRQHVTDLLQAHYVAGRLDSAELEGRIERALGAQTWADLDALLADLPPVESAPPAEPTTQRESGWSGHCAWSGHPRLDGEKSFRAHATSYLLVMALLVAIWLLTTPGGYFWPIWPMLGWGIGLASHGLAARGRGDQRTSLSFR